MHPAIKSVCVGLSFHPTISCHALSIYIVKTSRKKYKEKYWYIPWQKIQKIISLTEKLFNLFLFKLLWPTLQLCIFITIYLFFIIRPC